MPEIFLSADQSIALDTAMGQVPVRDIAGHLVGYVRGQANSGDVNLGNGELDTVDRILAMTRDLIPGQITIEESADPEYPEATYIVFLVQAERKPKDFNALIDLELQWHRKVAEIAPADRARVRLLIE
jgi:hypothetical protein